MQEMTVLAGWVRARLDQRTEEGFTAVEWLIVLLGVIVIAGLAVAAVAASPSDEGLVEATCACLAPSAGDDSTYARRHGFHGVNG